MTAYTIEFEPLGRRGQCQTNESLLNCARECSAGISSVCGGRGTCGACRVRVLSGTVSEPTSRERETFSSQEIEEGWRLACQTYPYSDCQVSVPAGSMTASQRTQVEGLQTKVTIEPPVQVFRLQLAPPSLSDLQADADRLLEALSQQHQQHHYQVDIHVLRTLPLQLRAWNWKCQAAVQHNEVIAVEPLSSRQLGLAVDLGTTKIAGYLVDLSNGRTLAAQGMTNPQISHGDDIISRIHSINSTGSGAKLQKLVIDAINRLASELCDEAAANTGEILEAVVVGNTAMHHLLLGLPVGHLARAPYVPAACGTLDIKARQLGLHIAGGAFIHLLPNIAGFVGADHVAMLLATREIWQAGGLTLALDIGTNTEVSLISEGRITSASCASGPAFEGGHIKNGMRAASGAIERLQIVDNHIHYQTIAEAPPAGICGSGIIDTIAQLYRAGIIDQSGRMEKNHPRVHSRQKQPEFWLVNREERDGLPPITITQRDIRELQLAKAAIRTGIELLLKANGHSEDQLRQVIIAGAFGSYIDISSAITIGMLPSLPPDRFQQVGNAAGSGARLALLSARLRTEAQQIASRVRYLELAGASDFTPIFLQAGYLGRYRLKQGIREEID